MLVYPNENVEMARSLEPDVSECERNIRLKFFLSNSWFAIMIQSMTFIFK